MPIIPNRFNCKTLSRRSPFARSSGYLFRLIGQAQRIAMISRARNNNFEKGFTLIELMLVVALIGILAAMSVIIYSGYHCRVKQSEARNNLSVIYNSQLAYYVEYNRYANSLSDIGFSVKAAKNTGWYTYQTSGDEQVFTALAYNGPKGDAWSINQDKLLSNLTNGCVQ